LLHDRSAPVVRLDVVYLIPTSAQSRRGRVLVATPPVADLGWLPRAGVAGMWRFTAAIST
jgi:hypothetical protein